MAEIVGSWEPQVPGQDGVHTINYDLIDPNMSPSKQEALRLRLLTFHVEFEGLKFVFGENLAELAEGIDFLDQHGGNEEFVGYARWRVGQMTTGSNVESNDPNMGR